MKTRRGNILERQDPFRNRGEVCITGLRLLLDKGDKAQAGEVRGFGQKKWFQGTKKGGLSSIKKGNGTQKEEGNEGPKKGDLLFYGRNEKEEGKGIVGLRGEVRISEGVSSASRIRDRSVEISHILRGIGK